MTNAPRLHRYNRLEALSLWHRVTLESVVGSGPDLSTRQFVILTTIYLIDGAETYGFLKRGPDPQDRRSVVIQRTYGGSTYLRNFGDMICYEMKPREAKASAA